MRSQEKKTAQMAFNMDGHPPLPQGHPLSPHTTKRHNAKEPTCLPAFLQIFVQGISTTRGGALRDLGIACVHACVRVCGRNQVASTSVQVQECVHRNRYVCVHSIDICTDMCTYTYDYNLRTKGGEVVQAPTCIQVHVCMYMYVCM